MKKKHTVLLCVWSVIHLFVTAQRPVPVKPRILISTDIGGTDPDDNQSFTHFLMYSYLFQTEGLISSPSYGAGNKQELVRMIDLYEKDLPLLRLHQNGYPESSALRAVCKQGRSGPAPYCGYRTATEGSDWIIQCAKKKSSQPLWVLVWGGLDDLAQALHDAPEIQNHIRVYWIGGPNKKWSAYSYAYLAANFPKLWIIEANGSYNGFFSDTGVPDSLRNNVYYDQFIRGAGFLGKDFKNYYRGIVKMGDTPALLYMMDGDPADPSREGWGGSFERMSHSPRVVFTRNTTAADTVPVYSVVELHLKGPVITVPPDSVCLTMRVEAKIGVQSWAGYYLGGGDYAIRYCPKQAETLTYSITSIIPDFKGEGGQLTVNNVWPDHLRLTDYKLGANWYTDRSAPELFDGMQQGGKTVLRWRSDALLDWARHWNWLR